MLLLCDIKVLVSLSSYKEFLSDTGKSQAQEQMIIFHNSSSSEINVKLKPNSYLDLDVWEKFCIKAPYGRALKHNMFRKSNVWIFRGKLNEVPDKFFSKYNRVFVMRPVNKTAMEVYKIYRITKFSPKLIVELFQIWSLVDNSMLYYKDLSGSITNLMKEPIRVSYAFLSNDSINHLTDYR
ncbi:hypothetical protein HUJ05_000912 [Dendroctonus ponderosae]|nr:hypothetical protein HUJ05_000912 [Dendroctonus ponderosae]